MERELVVLANCLILTPLPGHGVEPTLELVDERCGESSSSETAQGGIRRRVCSSSAACAWSRERLPPKAGVVGARVIL
jgi:hypothetical protein